MSASPPSIDVPLLGAVAAGGAVGASCRHLAILAWPDAAPAVILVVNVVGCFLMGALVVRAERGLPRLARPFLGTGVLGGFTTVSTYAATSQALLASEIGPGLVYALVTPVLAVAAAGLGSLTARGPRGRS